MFGWSFDGEQEPVIGEGGVVVLVKLDVEIGGLPDGEVIFPSCAGVVVSGDGFFACGAAE